MSRALIADPAREGMQLIARDESGRAIGFATIFWTWSTTRAARIGVMNDLFVAPGGRGSGRRRRAHRRLPGALPRRTAPPLLAWRTALDNHRAQAVYDRVGGRRSQWLDYDLPVQGGGVAVKIVKPGAEHDTPRGILGGAELSQATTGATNIYMAKFRVPPGARSRPHYHANCESGLYMLSGRIAIHWGEHLEQTARGRARRPALRPAARDPHRRQPLRRRAGRLRRRARLADRGLRRGALGRRGPALGHVRGDRAREARRLLRRSGGRGGRAASAPSPTRRRRRASRPGAPRSPPATRRWRPRPGARRPGVPSCCMRYSSPVWATHAARKRGACQSSPSHHRPRSCSREMSRRLSAA